VIQHIACRARASVSALHCPNGGWRSRVEGAILKAIGTVAGVPDIICIFQICIFQICIFQGRVYGLESPKGRLTDVGRRQLEAETDMWRRFSAGVSRILYAK
jgi:hypothetical protein